MPYQLSRILVSIATIALFAGCASPSRQTAMPNGDWRYSDIVSAIDAYRKQDLTIGAKLPTEVRSIYIKGADLLSVYLADSKGVKGSGCELTLKRSPAGTWVVSSARFFEY
jgi:hypothetical protein